MKISSFPIRRVVVENIEEVRSEPAENVVDGPMKMSHLLTVCANNKRVSLSISLMLIQMLVSAPAVARAVALKHLPPEDARNHACLKILGIYTQRLDHSPFRA